MSPDSTGGHRSTTPTDAIASARTCSIVSAIVAGSGPVVRAAICSISCDSRPLRMSCLHRSKHLIDRLGARSPQVTARFRAPMRSSDRRRPVRSARARHPARSVAVGRPASSGLVGRVANVIVLCALPTSTGDGGRPSRSTNPTVQRASSDSMSTLRVENSTSSS